jgi:uncharacterized protein YwgA
MPSELVLLLVRAAGGEVDAKTVLQELGYFCAVTLKRDLDFRLDFYGPFSALIDAAAERLVMTGELSERLELPATWGRESRRYVYRLEDAGRHRAEAVAGERGEIARCIDWVFEKARQADPDLEGRTLASAAKIHWIFAEYRRSMRRAEIPGAAARLGWQMSPDEIERTRGVLESLELADA